jgi:hypothetical protein
MQVSVKGSVAGGYGCSYISCITTAGVKEEEEVRSIHCDARLSYGKEWGMDFAPTFSSRGLFHGINSQEAVLVRLHV